MVAIILPKNHVNQVVFPAAARPEKVEAEEDREDAAEAAVGDNLYFIYETNAKIL